MDDLSVSGVVLHEVVGVLPADAVHVGNFVPELDAVELAGVLKELRPDRKRKRLSRKTFAESMLKEKV